MTGDPSSYAVFRLVTTFELEAKLGAELERLRVELFRGEPEGHDFQVRLWRYTVVPSVLDVDEQAQQAEVVEWQILEEFSDFLDDKDTGFEADSTAAAEARVLAALQRRIGEMAWAKA